MKVNFTKKYISVKRIKTVNREEYLDYMTFQSGGKPLFTQFFGLMPGLAEEWIAQGATEEELNLSAFTFRHPLRYYINVNAGWHGGNEEEVIYENDEEIVFNDRMGRKMKLCKSSATIPLPMTYPVKNMDDWLRIKKHYEFTEDRFRKNWLEDAIHNLSSGNVIMFSVPGAFDEPRQLLGEEELCYAYYDQPELIYDIQMTISDTIMKILEKLIPHIKIDEAMFHEDLAGKSGSLIGPELMKDFLVPYYHRITSCMKDNGSRLFSVDTDGNINTVIASFIDGGVNILSPFEAAAGMDIVKVREKFGKALGIMGGIDKFALTGTTSDIISELEYKLPPMIKTGACMFSLDHRVPNGTPLNNYRFYVRKTLEIINSFN